MFIHEQTGLIITQYEHARFSGVIASYWGNNIYQEVPLPKDEYLLGVVEHDRGFGDNDNIVIGRGSLEYSQQERIELIENGIKKSHPNPITEITSLLQIHQLCGFQSYLTPYAEKIEKNIDKLITENGLNKDIHKYAQTITRACDNVSYDFCDGIDGGFEMSVISNFETGEYKKINYSIDGSKIIFKESPLKKPISGFIIGYEQKKYPEKLIPHHIEYSIN